MEAFSRPPEPQGRPIPLVVGTSIEWRSPMTGEVVGLTGVAPRGRKGLWAAMAAASKLDSDRGSEMMGMGEVTEGGTDEDDVTIDVDALEAGSAEPDPSIDVEEAHMAYLAKVAFADAGDRVRATTPSTRKVAQVVDLDVFRARYARRRH